jgi:hypothetical protein
MVVVVLAGEPPGFPDPFHWSLRGQAAPRTPSDRLPTLVSWSRSLTDLWREAGEITEWNLDVVAAFMRAAYGKGYCDALTEDAPGSLCHDHGYRIPGRRPAPARD